MRQWEYSINFTCGIFILSENFRNIGILLSKIGIVTRGSRGCPLHEIKKKKNFEGVKGLFFLFICEKFLFERE